MDNYDLDSHDLSRIKHHAEKIVEKVEEIRKIKDYKKIEKVKTCIDEIKNIDEIKEHVECIEIALGKRAACEIRWILIVLCILLSIVPLLLNKILLILQYFTKDLLSLIGNVYLFFGSVILIYDVAKWKIKDCIDLVLRDTAI